MDNIDKRIFTNEDWTDLLKLIKAGNVVPVLGEELLITEYNGITTTLYNHIAQYICVKEDILYEKCSSLNDVIHHLKIDKYKDERKDHIKNGYLKHISDFLSSTDLTCEALEILAQITDFRMFITTTFDDLAMKTFEKFRGNNIETKCWVEQRSNVSSRQYQEDIKNLEEMPSNLIFHLFGKYIKENTIEQGHIYAITDDDILMYLSQMADGTFQNMNISRLLKKDDVHLLFLGWSHSDWLYRFLMYTLKKEKIYFEKTEHHKIYLTDEKIKNNESLKKFILRLNTLLYDKGDLLTFIKELYNRWNSSKPQLKKYYPKKPDIFLSYANENTDKVWEIYNWLEQEFINCKIWFDKDGKSLSHGDMWREEINYAISRCKIFIPILSEDTIKAEPHREFLKEWEIARQRMEDAALIHKDFIVPIRIDEVDKNNRLFTKQFNGIHIDDFDLKNKECLKKEIKKRLN